MIEKLKYAVVNCDIAKKVDADVIGVSALLSTTVRTAPQVCEALAKSGKREAVKVIIGGAAVNRGTGCAVPSSTPAANRLQFKLIRNMAMPRRWRNEQA